MKKLLAILLVLVTVSALAVSVSAEPYAIDGAIELFSQYGTGISVDGNTVSLNLAELDPGDNPKRPIWSNGELMVNDNLRDGFTVKISDINWSKANNAVAIVYGNTAHMNCDDIINADGSSTGYSNFTLLVKKDGSIVLWGNAYNSNHTFGKWAPVLVTSKTLGKVVTEFTYKMVPNEDNSKYYFFVDDILVYEYDIAKAEANAAVHHEKSIFATPTIPCNFGFMILSGEGNGNEKGWSAAPLGEMSYTVAEVDSVGTHEGSLTPETEPPANDTTAAPSDDTTAKPVDKITAKSKDTTAADTTAAPTDDVEADGLSVGIIIAIAAAAAAAVAVVVIVIVVAKKKKKQ